MSKQKKQKPKHITVAQLEYAIKQFRNKQALVYITDLEGTEVRPVIKLTKTYTNTSQQPTELILFADFDFDPSEEEMDDEIRWDDGEGCEDDNCASAVAAVSKSLSPTDRKLLEEHFTQMQAQDCMEYDLEGNKAIAYTGEKSVTTPHKAE